ncbi:unnamed protein product [Amoebophrya sp. A25]|nr:unnamed protein product [Amoebophrya sp. A25]|eukprot:GSA25T00004306001.1
MFHCVHLQDARHKMNVEDSDVMSANIMSEREKRLPEKLLFDSVLDIINSSSASTTATQRVVEARVDHFPVY